MAKVLLDLFNVPDEEQEAYVHDARTEARGTVAGIQIRPSIRSRCWSDGEDRVVRTKFKPLKRE